MGRPKSPWGIVLGALFMEKREKGGRKNLSLDKSNRKRKRKEQQFDLPGGLLGATRLNALSVENTDAISDMATRNLDQASDSKSLFIKGISNRRKKEQDLENDNDFIGRDMGDKPTQGNNSRGGDDFGNLGINFNSYLGLNNFKGSGFENEFNFYLGLNSAEYELENKFFFSSEMFIEQAERNIEFANEYNPVDRKIDKFRTIDSIFQDRIKDNLNFFSELLGQYAASNINLSSEIIPSEKTFPKANPIEE